MPVQPDALRAAYDWCVAAVNRMSALSHALKAISSLTGPDDDEAREFAYQLLLAFDRLGATVRKKDQVNVEHPAFTASFAEPCVLAGIERRSYHVVARDLSIQFFYSVEPALMTCFDSFAETHPDGDVVRLAADVFENTGFGDEEFYDDILRDAVLAHISKLTGLTILQPDVLSSLLARLTKEYLLALRLVDTATFHAVIEAGDTQPESREPMTDVERDVWDAITESPKSSAELAKELEKSSDAIRQTIRTLRRKGYDIDRGGGGYFRSSAAPTSPS